MPVPEASSHVNDCFCLGDYNVGFAFKPLVTHSEPPTAGEEPFAHEDFRQSVLRPDVTHAPMALLWAESVHIVKSRCSSRKLNPIEPSY